jgi:hypothetical protein
VAATAARSATMLSGVRRWMPRIAAEPFMRVVGEMLDLEEEAATGDEIIDAETVEKVLAQETTPPPAPVSQEAIVTDGVEGRPRNEGSQST